MGTRCVSSTTKENFTFIYICRCGTQANVTHLYYTPMPEWKICDMDITITLSDLLKDIMQQLEMMEEFLIQKPAIPKNCIDQEGYTNFWKPESPIKDFVGHIKDIEDVLLEMGMYILPEHRQSG